MPQAKAARSNPSHQQNVHTPSIEFPSIAEPKQKSPLHGNPHRDNPAPGGKQYAHYADRQVTADSSTPLLSPLYVLEKTQ